MSGHFLAEIKTKNVPNFALEKSGHLQMPGPAFKLYGQVKTFFKVRTCGASEYFFQSSDLHSF